MRFAVQSRRALAFASALFALALALAAPAATRSTTKGVANAALVEAAKSAPVKAIDYDQERCDDRTVEQWLTALAGREARQIVWTAGPCQLVGPGIDAGSSWCAQAAVTLTHPLGHDDRPLIEVFFEAPKEGRPGQPYAFRGAMHAVDGDGVSRFRSDFEAAWTSRFSPRADAIVDCAQ
jgi:hypothetical protein